MSATATASLQLKKIASQWAKDPFRPHLQHQNFLRSLSEHPRLTNEVVEAARALKDNDLQKRYPLTVKSLRPASMPLYYSRLVEGFEKSALGIGRPWWKVFFNIW